MKKIWYRIFEFTGLVYLPVVGVYFVYGAGRLLLLGDILYFAEVTLLLAIGLLLEMVLGITVG